MQLSKQSYYLTALVSACLLLLNGIVWDAMFIYLSHRPVDTVRTVIWMGRLLPLLWLLFRLYEKRVYHYQIMTMFVLLFFTEGVMRAWSETGVSQLFALLEIVCSVVLFISSLAYVRSVIGPRKRKVKAAEG